MSQLALSAQAGENVIADDACGRIVDTPGFVQAEVARVWFDDIRGAVAWEAPRRSFHLDLEAGSLLLMSSLAFRVRP
ncbi:MAG TPA: hypothetical protein VFQ62_03905 [Methylomirabilota bacterium]|nr:hypothetical protein [Methylomirabilota bacterium]